MFGKDSSVRHFVAATPAALVLGLALAGGCEDPSAFEASLVVDDPQAGEDPQASVEEGMDLADPDEQGPSKKLICPNGPESCPIPVPLCQSSCTAYTACGTACTYGEEPATCGEYGVCLKSCAQVCSATSACGTPCSTNGGASTCGSFGTCNYTPPDCLVEFWTGYGYTGTRDCYGTPADVEQAAANGGKLVVKAVKSNDQYSSFRTIEQVCADRFIHPCHLAGVPNKIKTGATTIYKDANLTGQWAQFAATVDGVPDMRKKYWQDNLVLGNTDDKLSSFIMEFSVAPTCYQADGIACPGLCIDGGAWLNPIECTVSTDTNNQQGWAQVDPVKNVWVRFTAQSYAPTKYYNVNGQIRWGLQEHFKFVYPGYYHELDWVYSNAPVPPIYFQGSVVGAF